MRATLNVTDDITHCGNIGHVVPDFKDACALAARHGFQAVNIDLGAKPRRTAAEYRAILANHGLQPAAFGFPIDLFEPGQDFERSARTFESHAALAREIGCGLTLCYIPPFSAELRFNDLYLRTAERLRRLRPVLEAHDIRIGFEFIGPVETRRDSKHDFIHTIDGTRALIADTGLYGRGGFKLDVHHWQNSGAGLLDLRHLDLEYILYVELNDGLPGHDIHTMPEFERELPLATGVTDIASFMRILRAKGYDGPVAVEPWNQQIKDMPLEEAVRVVKLSLDRCLSLA